MAQKKLSFQYQAEECGSGLIGFSGLPLYLELALSSGLVDCIDNSLDIKVRGWRDSEILLSLIMLNIAGGECISDIERLEQDVGLRELLLQFATQGMRRKERRAYENRWRKKRQRGLPSNAAIHRYLPAFHSPEEEEKRLPGYAFIPAANEHLQALIALNQSLIETIQRQSPSKQATLDQDATLTQTQKSNAHYCYKKFKAYQPFNTYWAEHGIILHSEFRDGNVPASYEQLRLLKESLDLLPADVERVLLRSDSAGYQQELLEYCAEGKNERFGVIEFTIAARISKHFKEAVKMLEPDAWQVIYEEQADGSRIATAQEWAEVCFIPQWAATRKIQPDYRYLAIREAFTPMVPMNEVNVQTLETKENNYKLFAVVTNRDLEGSALLQWHRERCGKSEQVHSIQKEDLAGGQLPSNLFGVNAAWWHIMILSLNLNRLMQQVALPEALKERRMKATRLHVIQLPGRVITHARQVYLKVEQGSCELLQVIRDRIASLLPANLPLVDTS